jgi:hypothetical protein
LASLVPFKNSRIYIRLVIFFCAEDCVTLPGEVQVKDEPFSDVQVESVSSISSAVFSEMNEVVGRINCESEQDSLLEVKQELDETSDQENDDGMVGAFVNRYIFYELYSLFECFLRPSALLGYINKRVHFKVHTFELAWVRSF